MVAGRLASRVAHPLHPKLTLSALFGTSTGHPLQRLTDQYINSLDLTPNNQAATPAPNSEVDPLIERIREDGGYIAPWLTVGRSPTLGCRGVIAQGEPSTLADDEALVIVPEPLLMSPTAARQGLSSVLSNRSLDAIEGESLTMLLALFLCMERRKGAASLWAAYINTMPQQVPGGWAMRKEQQAAALRSLDPQQLIARASLRQAGKTISDRVAKHCKAYGRSLRISQADLEWGFGMVFSRCYSCRALHDPVEGKQEPVMLPFIDLCNHASGGLQPGWGQLGREGRPAWAACLTNTQSAPVALRQGEELFIDYFTAPMDAAKRFLTYGFV